MTTNFALVLIQCFKECEKHGLFKDKRLHGLGFFTSEVYSVNYNKFRLGVFGQLQKLAS
jgi:hypothetical protein